MASPPIENPTGSSVGAVFLSYASQDAEVARRIGEALRAVGINVWLDESKLVGGDAWDATIRKQIKECALFLPMISAATQARGEGYFRLEWKLAVDRSHLMARDQAFLVPIVLDDTANATARVPDEFHAVQWTRITGGEIPATFPVRVKKLLSTEGSVSESGPVFAARSTTARRSVAKPLLVGVLVVAIALWGAWYFAPRGGQAGDGLPLAMVFPGKSIAVLPFKPLVASHRDEVLEAGMADTLIAKLSMTREMIVPSLDSARRYDNEKKDSIAAGRALRVNAVLEGNLQKLGDRLRVNVRLIKVVDGTSMWSGTFEEKFTDVFAVQDAIAQ